MTVRAQSDAVGFVDRENFAPLERHALPNTQEVWFRESDHSYWKEAEQRKGAWCGKGRLAGVSTVVKAFDTSSDGLMTWAAKLQCSGVAALFEKEPDGTWLFSGEDVWQALSAHELTWRHIRDKAAKRGTNVHQEALHAVSTGSPVPDFDAMTDEEKGYGMGVVNFWHQHDPSPVLSEQVVADLDLGVAGRFDLVYESRSGVRTMLDLKTTEVVPRKKKRPFYPVTHQAQLAGYSLLLERSGFEPVTALSVLYVDSSGEYELVPGHASHQDFRLALELYRSAAEIRAAGSAARKMAA